VLFSVMQLPEWSLSLFFALLLLGLPMVVVFAWVFEMTPEGIKREQEVQRDASITGATGRKLDGVTLILVAVGVIYLIGESLLAPDITVAPATLPQQEAADVVVDGVEDQATDASVAVLPFADFSAGGDQAHFADGLADTLLHMLAQVEGLRVAARTSSFSFRDSELPVGEIAEQLNVATILEGSVQTSGERLRVIAQLIDSADGSHLWSGTFDRTSADIFAIQDEIADEVVEAMRLEVMHESDTQRADGGTDNLDAYNAYLLGRTLIEKRNIASITQSADHFREAVELDPNYALALSQLALSWLLRQESDSTYGTLEYSEVEKNAGPLLERALSVAPELSEVQAVMGLLLLHRGDNDEGLEYLERAIELNPNNALALVWASGEVNDPKVSLEMVRRAFRLDPVSNVVRVNLINGLLRFGLRDEALDVYTHSLALAPGNPLVMASGGMIQWWSGDLAGALRTLQSIDIENGQSTVGRDAYIWLRRTLGITDGMEALRAPKSAGIYDYAMGDFPRIEAAERRLLKRQPDSPDIHGRLAETLFAQGDTEGAARHFRLALSAEDGERYFNKQASLAFVYLPALTAAVVFKSMGSDAEAEIMREAAWAAISPMLDTGYISPGGRVLEAALLAFEGQADATIRSLAQAIDTGFRAGWQLDRDPALKPLRSMPGFAAQRERIRELVGAERAKLGLPQEPSG
jgi:TolB-like protein/tetratricopeptide (TPR) repeat protein